jgi:dienelactone hydrolase
LRAPASGPVGPKARSWRTVGWQLELYSGTEHGFSMPKNADEERANTQSQGSMARFFKEVFGT